MKELELQGKSKSKPLPLVSSKTFDVAKHTQLVPPFQEKEVDKYFFSFWEGGRKPEMAKRALDLTFAERCNWQSSRDLHSVFTRTKLRFWQNKTKLFLRLVAEAYRQKFRDCRKEPDQTHVEFARTKEQIFDRWCSSKKVGSDHAKLRQLMLVEEFKWCINSDVRAFLNEKEVENLDVAARPADDYSLTHKASFVNKQFSQSRPFSPQSKPYSPQSDPKFNPSNPSDNSSHSFTPKPRFSGENKGQSPLSQPICNYCKQSGHMISECVALKRKREKEKQESPKPTGLTSLRLKP